MSATMKVALIHDHYDSEHLAAVVDRMHALGAPTIKAVWLPAHEIWAALEGCHRLRACQFLGMAPQIEEVEYGDGEATLESLGLDCRDDVTIEQVCDGAYCATVLEFQ